MNRLPDLPFPRRRHWIRNGTLLISKIREEYPDRMMLTFSVFPSPKVSDTVVEPYNRHPLRPPTRGERRRVPWSSTMKLSTTFASELSSSPIQARRNMLPPLPRPAQLRPPKTGGQSYPIPAIALLHGGFCTPDVAWITAVPGPHHPGADTANVGCEDMMCAADPRHGRYLTASAMFRGKMSTKEVDEQMINVQNKNSSYFVSGYQTMRCSRRVSEQFTVMFRRKAFLHWYTGEGMDEMEFTEAESNMNDLVSEYQQYQEAVAAEDEEEYDEEVMEN
ncbi:Tubulin beta-4 chain [Vitis vinifera]|uniref:Tubulin beta-4 chain n=1 Tax=Vitis vinifera TaxID=29760 RepID=A0A438C0H1_VITVI|nr:Tubulin beta-4 chain [Vitis vinifera]